MKDESNEFLSKILYPEEYDFNYIKTYCSLNSELKQLIEKSGNKKEFSRKYFRNLQFLVKLKKNCVEIASFEKLKNVDNDLYSIRFIGSKNIRIIFIFKEIHDKEQVILLNVFQEKDAIDYSKGILVAYDRITKIFRGK
ncbi:MAG: hypothetical protein AB7V48_18145 [Sedimentibacter sp.]